MVKRAQKAKTYFKIVLHLQIVKKLLLFLNFVRHIFLDQSNTIFILIDCISSNNTFRVPTEIFLISLFQNTPVREILLPLSLFLELT